MKTVIYTQRVEIIESYQERRDCADQRIAEFIMACGYLPIPIPNHKKVAEKLIDAIKPAGIILTGGNSLVRYGGNAPERDEMDAELIRLAVDKNIPLYGFCRGMQSILNYYGCELVNVIGHVAIRHKILGQEGNFKVNSYHNQACLELNCTSLEAILKSEDGVIEMVRHKNFPIVGTMWHPEREHAFVEHDIRLVQELFG